MEINRIYPAVARSLLQVNKRLFFDYRNFHFGMIMTIGNLLRVLPGKKEGDIA